MNRTLVLDQSKLLGFRVLDVEVPSGKQQCRQRAITGAKIGKVAAPVRFGAKIGKVQIRR
jgi:hypothetical protein